MVAKDVSAASRPAAMGTKPAGGARRVGSKTYQRPPEAGEQHRRQQQQQQ
jgi:hypothetical protein